MTATESRPFDHFLLTRFSAVMGPGEPAGEDWLRYRLGFFHDACLPSVTRQRGAEFEWLVLFDDRCSDGFREDVEHLAEEGFTPIWSHEPFRRTTFAPYVAARSSAAHVITTRIDSDDAMAIDFMARVQAQFGPFRAQGARFRAQGARQDRMFVNFPRGIQIDRSGAVLRSDIASSPFLSLIERRHDDALPDTVYVAKHARARGHAPLLQVAAPVMWAQVVHDTNVSNIVNGWRTHPRIVRQRFDIDLTYDAAIGGPALLRARARQASRLAQLWWRHPGEFTKWIEAEAWTARGAHLWPQNSGDSASDRLLATALRTRSRAREAKWALRERVNRPAARGVRVVAGDPGRLVASDRVVLLAEWSRGRRIRPDALRAATAYAEAGWPTLVIAARDPWVRLTRPRVPSGVVVARRANSAYDFGSWRDALAAFPELAGKHRVILTNDSLVGPLGPLEGLLRRIDDSSARVWAATMNHRPIEHLQSYLVAFSGGLLAESPLREFFAGVGPQPSKTHVIRTYEFGLSNLVAAEGWATEVGWDQSDLGLAPEDDAVLTGWQALVDAGFPFVKRTLLTDPRFDIIRGRVEDRLRDSR